MLSFNVSKPFNANSIVKVSCVNNLSKRPIWIRQFRTRNLMGKFSSDFVCSLCYFRLKVNPELHHYFRLITRLNSLKSDLKVGISGMENSLRSDSSFGSMAGDN